MFTETKETFIDKLVQQYNLDEMDRKILQAYIELPDAHRLVIKNYLKSVNSILSDEKQDELDVEKELELYKKELEMEKKAKGRYSASNYTDEEKDA